MGILYNKIILLQWEWVQDLGVSPTPFKRLIKAERYLIMYFYDEIPMFWKIENIFFSL